MGKIRADDPSKVQSCPRQFGTDEFAPNELGSTQVSALEVRT